MRIKNCWQVSLGLTFLLLSSCASYQSEKKQAKIDAENMLRAEQQLADASTSINNSLMELASIQRAVYPAVRLPDLPDAARIGMGRLASIDWTGPIEPIVRNIASVTGYQLRVIGKAPPIPVLVSVSKKNTPLAVILRDAAYQCGDKVDIIVYPNSKVIELRYAKI